MDICTRNVTHVTYSFSFGARRVRLGSLLEFDHEQVMSSSKDNSSKGQLLLGTIPLNSDNAITR